MIKPQESRPKLLTVSAKGATGSPFLVIRREGVHKRLLQCEDSESNVA